MFSSVLLLLSTALAQPALPTQPHPCVREEVVVYATPHGQPLRMTLFLPQTAQPAPPRPAVLLFHGGAWFAGWRAQLAWLGRDLARAGYVAAAVDYRKLPGHGFPACVEDGKAAVRYLRAHAQQYNIDPGRIIASGHSAGGYIAVMLACTPGVSALEGTENPGYSSAVQAAISVYGALELGRYRESPDGILGNLSYRVVRKFLETLEGEEESRFKQASPAHYLTEHTPPVLLLQGTEDWLVPLEVAEEFHQALTQRGIATKLVRFEGRSHSFDRFNTHTRPEVLAEMLAFLQELDLAPAGG